MRIFIFNCLSFIIFTFFCACSNKQYQTLFQKKASSNDTLPAGNAQVLKQYRIKPQDLLQIRNLQNSKDIVDLYPSLTGTAALITTVTQVQNDGYLVEDDGTVALTGLGRIPVIGLTRVEAERLIEGLYHKVLLKDPIIEIKILNLAVTIYGEVRVPGNHKLGRDRTTLVEMIGEAGGLTEKANESNVKIIRGKDKTPEVIQIDLSNIQSINDPKAVLQSGDIIYISENKRAVRTENIQTFSTLVQPAILALNTLLIILSLTRR